MKKEKFLQEIKKHLKNTIIPTLEDTALPSLGKKYTYNEEHSIYISKDSLCFGDLKNKSEASHAIAKDISQQIMNRVSYYSNAIYSSVKDVRCVYASLNKYDISISEGDYIKITVRYQLILEAEVRKVKLDN